MVVTKIEAGKYSIVTTSGLKFSAMKQRNHYWTVQNDSLGIIAGYPTLKECEEWAEKQMVEKPAKPVTSEEFVKTDEPAETKKADGPKSRVEKLMPDFWACKVIFHTPTQEVCDLLMKEFAKPRPKWRWDTAVDTNSLIRWVGANTCFLYRGEPINGIGYCSSKEFYEHYYPSISIVTLTAADFDKPKKEFTKDDLKTGMVVECRNHAKYMVIEGKYECECGMNVELMLIAEGTDWMDGNRYHSDLTNDKNSNFNIDKVYKRKMQGLGWMLNNVSDENLIWQRKPEYDWSKAEIDMPMLGRHGGDAPWRKRYFAKYENGIVLSWSNGCTSWTTDKTCHWAYALPYKGNEHLVEGEDK